MKYIIRPLGELMAFDNNGDASRYKQRRTETSTTTRTATTATTAATATAATAAPVTNYRANKSAAKQSVTVDVTYRSE